MGRFQILLPVFTMMLSLAASAAEWQRSDAGNVYPCQTLSPTVGECYYDFTADVNPDKNLRITNECKPFVWVDPDITGPQDLARVNVARGTSRSQAYNLCTEVDADTKFTRGAALGGFLCLDIETPPSGVTARAFAFCEATTSVVGTPSRCARFDSNGLLVAATADCPDGDTGGGGGDSITLNDATFTATDADFDDDSPAAPASSVNVRWQGSGTSPSDISAYLLLTDIDGLGIGVSGTELVLDQAASGAIGGIELDTDLGGTYDAPTVVDLSLASEAQGDLAMRGATNWARLPDDASSGQCLLSGGGGGDPAWGACPSGGNHAILSTTHTDATTDTVAQGDIIYGNATPAWAALDIGGAGTYLRSDGNVPAWDTFTTADITNIGGSLIDHAALVGTGANTAEWTAAIPDCNTENHLTFEQTGNTWGCESDSNSGGATALHAITAPTANGGFSAAGEYEVEWEWLNDLADAGTITYLELVADHNPTADSGTQNLLTLNRKNTGSFAFDNLLSLLNSSTSQAVTNAIRVTTGAGGITNFIKFTGTGITNFAEYEDSGTKTIAVTEMTILDGGIAIAELSDVSGTTGTGSTVVLDTDPTINIGGGFLEIPNGTAPAVSTAVGRIALDTTDDQVILRIDNGASPVDKVLPTRLDKCFGLESLADTDELGVWLPQDGVAITNGWCSCFGANCATPAQFVFSDDVAGTDMTGTVTCSDYPTLDTKTAISGSNTLTALEGLVVDVTNTPTADGQYSICWEYTVTRE